MLIVEPEDWDEEEEDDHPLSSDVMFDAWRTLREGTLEPLRLAITNEVLQDLAAPGRRTRSDLKANVEAIVSSILANLLVTHRSRHLGARLVVSRRRDAKSRYDRRGFRKLPDAIDSMKAQGLLDVFPHKWRERRTAVRAKGRLRSALGLPEVQLADVIRAPGEELLVLTARPPQRWMSGQRQPNTREDYAEDTLTAALRSEMEELTNFLSSQDISLGGVKQPSPSLHRQFTLRTKAEFAEWNLHGRIYGGFWMTLPEGDRKHLRINGEPLADLDFTAMFPRLAYIEAGQIPPERDPYALVGLEDARSSAKAALSALISVPKPLRQLPPRLRSVLPQDWDLQRLRAAVIERHPLLEPYLEQDLGMKLMFVESRILLAALRDLMGQGVPALPMHDGMMVPVSKAEAGKSAMERASRTICGVAIPVAMKTV